MTHRERDGEKSATCPTRFMEFRDSPYDELYFIYFFISKKPHIRKYYILLLHLSSAITNKVL